ncbi:aspartate/glutamate racemase family protein [Paraburkholderia susongensis]|uniref:Asp/Glu/hydantoin racemase n=1 Tax=Paraburkholderia susongensis TaxID=1515439 RepID=A0A1X7IRZ3_9BURK|nr:aspartate/glutamate racemase family protein [Paraburkholderia susongensis]SMG17949.1 Asp/Glu/hydantoin racemase [Paraburkholderia susongensis]
MRLLVLNPNISDSVSALISAEAKRAASPGVLIDVLTAPFGVAYIETRLEATIGAYAATCMAADHHASYDGVIVAAFGDPGLHGIKELLDKPVVGLTEAALTSACLLGQRFSIIAISSRIRAWYAECVAYNGLTSRLASIRGLDQPLSDVGGIQQDHGAALKQLCLQVVEQDGADVVILAGAPLAGLARSLSGTLPVPVVDGVSSAVRHCETLVSLAPGRVTAGSYALPPAKPHTGLPAGLAACLAAGRRPD